jgi:lipopolysaccharide/colanic/teichoic acid biosynthesis glycosyltransferase
LKRTLKRIFDLVFSALILLTFSWLLLLAWILAIVDTRTNGVFMQERIGQFGNRFKIYKLRTFQINSNGADFKISKMGQLLRNYKLDELPQLINVLKGEMSIVGPRPDIEGYYDVLKGEERKILQLKPGLTSLASLKYYNEDEILEKQDFPLVYNDAVLFRDKVKLNLEYYYNHSILGDLRIVWATCKKVFGKN